MTYTFDISVKNIIAASAVKGIGQKSLVKLLKHNISKCDNGEFVKEHFRITKTDWNSAIESSNSILDSCLKFNIKPLLYSMEEYPRLLTELEDAPPILYVKGVVSALRPNAVAVIGSRKAHEMSKNVAFKFGQFFADQQSAVVSGLALGCDTAAHNGALENSGITIAVLAHGLDMVYPADNRQLAEKIVDQGGALISEYPPRMKPFRTFFVQRDRIQSGLSKATIVVQTTTTGGSMHTSKFCIKQKRVLAAWHPLTEELRSLCSGNFELISSSKAVALKDKDDLQNFWNSISGTDVKLLVADRIENIQKDTPATVPLSHRQISQPIQRSVQLSLLR